MTNLWFLKSYTHLNFTGNSWSKHEAKKYDFQPYDVFNSMIERNTVDSLFLPGINGSYMTVISEDRNDLFNLLPGVSRMQCREPGSLPELRQSLERSRWLEFMEQTTGEESTTKRSIPQVCRGFPWSLQQSSNQYMCTRPGEEHHKGSGWTTPRVYTGPELT